MTLLSICSTSYFDDGTMSQRVGVNSTPLVEPTSGAWNSDHRNGRWRFDGTADQVTYTTSSTSHTLIFQAWIYSENMAQSNEEIGLRFRNNDESLDHVLAYFYRNGRIQFRRGTSTQIAITPKTVFTENTWNYYEIKVRIHDTEGGIQMRVNGEMILNEAALDTKNGGTANRCDSIILDKGSAANMYMCNPILMNEEGSAPFNDFIGQKRVYVLFPNASGSHSNWTRGSTGSTNWQLVDDTDPDGDSTFVESNSTGTIDMYNFEPLSTNCTTVDAVAVNVSAKASTGSTANMRTRIDSTGSVATSATFGLTTSYAITQTLFSTNPASTAGWTPAAVNALMAGMEVVA